MVRVEWSLCRSPVALRLAVSGVSLLACLGPGTTVAQEAPPSLEFSFSNPGARSLGLGGAFASWITGPSSVTVTMGASAGVLGLLLAYGLMYPEREVLLYFVIRIKMKYLVWGLAIVELLLGLSGMNTGVAHFAHLGGMGAGYLYLRQDWRLGALGRRVRGIKARQQMARNAKRAERRQAQAGEIDRILEKISSQGIDSLTEEERRILRDASRH